MNFLCSKSQVQTVPLNKHSTAFVTLPRNSRKYQSSNDAEVRLVPFFDGVGPRTSANGSSEPHPVSDEIPHVPPPAMFDNTKDNTGTTVFLYQNKDQKVVFKDL